MLLPSEESGASDLPTNIDAKDDVHSENKEPEPNSSTHNRKRSWHKEIQKIQKRSSAAMSVFGKAPTLEIMRIMNKNSAGNQSLFRGAEFWYRFRLYFPYLAPVGFLLGLILALTAWNTAVGHMIIGGMLSLVSCTAVCASYVMIMPWRKHPSTMVFYRAGTDIFFSLAIIFMAIDYDINTTKSCGGFPEFLHFFLIAGESWLTTIALDLYFSLTNPFTSYKGNMRRYHFLVWSFTILITFALYNNPSCQGRVAGGLCWLRIETARDSCLWGYYLFWIVCLYVFQFGALLFAYHRLKKGLPLTFEIRKKCAMETFQCLSSFGAYLVTLCLFFIILVSSQPATYDPNSGWVTFGHIFLYLVSLRGFVDSLVWFAQHDFARDESPIIVLDQEKGLGSGAQQLQEIPSATDGQDDVDIENEDLDILDILNLPHRSERRDSITTGIEGGIKLLDAMNEMGESAVLSFDEADLSPQVYMQFLKYII
jgi:hypothetical protein